jgi:hypothetical protein
MVTSTKTKKRWEANWQIARELGGGGHGETLRENSQAKGVSRFVPDIRGSEIGLRS